MTPIKDSQLVFIQKRWKLIRKNSLIFTSVAECGKVYTQNSDIQRLYENLLEGSENHLAAYVRKIESVIGKGAYQAQVLTQEQVDTILGR